MLYPKVLIPACAAHPKRAFIRILGAPLSAPYGEFEFSLRCETTDLMLDTFSNNGNCL